MKQSIEMWSYRCKQNWVLKMDKLRSEDCDDDHVVSGIRIWNCMHKEDPRLGDLWGGEKCWGSFVVYLGLLWKVVDILKHRSFNEKHFVTLTWELPKKEQKIIFPVLKLWRKDSNFFLPFFKHAATDNNHAGVISVGTMSLQDCHYFILLLWIKTFEDGPYGEGNGETSVLGFLLSRRIYIMKFLRDGRNLVHSPYLLGMWDIWSGPEQGGKNWWTRLSPWFC